MRHTNLRHYLEMVAAMGVGMLVLGPVGMLLTEALGWSTFFDRTEPMALMMATEMSLGMAAWMRYRRHAWRMTLQMCAVMFLPFLVLFVPMWAGLITDGVVMLAGHLLMLPLMWLGMVRWQPASTHTHAADGHAVLAPTGSRR